MRRLCLLTLLPLLVLTMAVISPWVSASSSPPGPFEQVATTAIPAGYGELLNMHERSLTEGTPEAIKEISEKLSFYAQTIGRVSSALDIGGKLYMGETKEAAIAAALTVLGEAAGSAGGKAYLAAYGLTTLPVTTLITAFQVYRISEAELRASTTGLKLEQFYGLIESDPQLKNRNRDLGVGDPIPVTAQNVDYVWRKVMLDSAWRDLFRTYVVDELGRNWPDPGIWARWTLPGNVLEEGELYQRQSEYKSYIAGVLSYLNRAAKLREQQVVMQRYGEELRKQVAGQNLSSVFLKYTVAVGQLPKVREFASVSPGRTRKALHEDTINPLIQIINNSKRYAVDVLAWIPTSGRLGEERADLLKQLESIYNEAWSVRKFLVDRRRSEELRRAAAAQVAAWRASPYDLKVTFDELKSAIDAEFQRTEAITGIRHRLDEELRLMRKHYTDQSNKVGAEYEAAQQLRPVPVERGEEARKQFGIQLEAYHTVDRLHLSEVTAEVDDYVETLSFQAKMNEERLRERHDEIETLIRSFGATPWAMHVSRRDSYASLLNSFCGTFPSSGYLGISQYRFPGYSPNPGDSIGRFRGPHNSYIDSLRRKTLAAQKIEFCGRTTELASLIASIDQLIVMADSFAEKEKDIEELEEKIETMEELFAEPNPGIRRNLLEYWEKRLNEEHKPFVKNLRELFERGEALKGSARSAQQLYQTDLANIYNDLDYLTRLSRILYQLEPVLNEFIAEYSQVKVPGSGLKTYYVMRPEIRRDWAENGCSALIGKRVFMSPAEISQARQQLNRALTENQLIWFDDHYRIGLRAFVDLYIAERTGLSLPPPEHYTFIEWDGDCRIFMKEAFDDWQVALAAIDDFGLFFPYQMNKAVGGVGGYYGMLSKMLNIPHLDQPINNIEIDIDHYPANGLDYLKSIAAACWDDVMRASVVAVINTFEEKMAARQVWLAGESYFQEVQDRLADAVGNLRTLLYEGQQLNLAAANDAESMRKFQPEATRKFQEAAAKEPGVMAVLNAAVSDPKLSPQRQDFFKKRREEYIREFFFIRQWAGSASKSAPSRASEPQKPAFNEQPIINFYSQFKQAYERKNDSRLMSFLDDKWSAGDGTTLHDVEDYFRNMFRVFDEIRLDMSGLRVESLGEGRYRASYDLTITGRIYAHNIEHPEKSSVVEELGTDSSGRIKIIRTPQGRFWHQ